MNKSLLVVIAVCMSAFAFGQMRPANITPDEHLKYCFSEDVVQEAIRKHPGIEQQWKVNGERMYQKYLQKSQIGARLINDTIVIPVVFHLVDQATKQGWIPDRALYDQLNILNEAYNGLKADVYENVIPADMYSRKGDVPLKFVMARRAPDGSLTSGIERRVTTTPDRISIKYDTAGGLNAWNTDKYLNVWAGTFVGTSDDFLGVSTFPFLTTEGPQGVVIDITSLPFSTDVNRSYFPIYAEGATLVHEIGHYFYLYHTHGDEPFCNDDDFQTQPGWPLSDDAGPDGDDTPPEKLNDNTSYGNPSGNYTDGCAAEPLGEMYGSFMNYFDDRSLFMFSNGHKNRILDCIQRYRPDLANSDGATAPTAINDAYVVTATPLGNPERRAFIRKDVPFTVEIMNYGSTTLNQVLLTVSVDGSPVYQQSQTLNLAPGASREVNIGALNIPSGNKILNIYTSNPNGGTDAFTANDTLQSFVTVIGTTATAPVSQTFNSATFPPAGWTVWNPNSDLTWSYNGTSGFPDAGSASMQFRNYSGAGDMDELIMPAIDLGAADSASLTFQYAYSVYNTTDVTRWDGLEIYVSNDNGKSYQLLYKKTGAALATVATAQTTSFQALPGDAAKWKSEKVNLSPYLNGTPLLIKFRATNAFGNNLYLDNIQAFAINSYDNDARISDITGMPQYICASMPTPSVTLVNNGKKILNSVTLNYRIDDQPLQTSGWSGSLGSNDSVSIALNPLPTMTPGAYVFQAFTTKPNGKTDEFPANDTERFPFYVMGHATTPVSESFESTQFPPDQWVIQGNGNGHTWERTVTSAANGSASVMINNFQYDMGGRADNLMSPVITTDKTYDSLFLTLNYAYAPGAGYPSTGSAADTLEINVTTDCGNNFVTLFKKAGNDLITVADPADRKNSSFVAGSDDWDSLRFYLTPIVGNGQFQVFITSKGNHGNNLFVDNVNIFGVIVPPLLKEKGYLFYPSPFTDQFIIRHFELPDDLRTIRIYNMAGQLMWQQEYNGSASRMIYVNTPGWARGMYIVRLSYTNREVTDRVVKQ